MHQVHLLSNSCPPSLKRNSCAPSVSTLPSTSMPDIPAYHAAADIQADIRRERRQQVTLEADSLRDDLTPTLQRAMNLAHVCGSSSWLTSLPIKEHGFYLHKSAFVNALALRYGLVPSRTPTTCACGTSFSVEHVLSCLACCTTRSIWWESVHV